MQVVLYDTPGMHGTQDFKTRSESMRVGAAWQHSMECSSMGLIVDALRCTPRHPCECGYLQAHRGDALTRAVLHPMVSRGEGSSAHT